MLSRAVSMAVRGQGGRRASGGSANSAATGAHTKTHRALTGSKFTNRVPNSFQFPRVKSEPSRQPDGDGRTGALGHDGA